MHEFLHLVRLALGKTDARVTPVGLVYANDSDESNGTITRTPTIPGGALASSGDFLDCDYYGLFPSTGGLLIWVRANAGPTYDFINTTLSGYPGSQFHYRIRIMKSGSALKMMATLTPHGYSPAITISSGTVSFDLSDDWPLRFICACSNFSEVTAFYGLTVCVGKKP